MKDNSNRNKWIAFFSPNRPVFYLSIAVILIAIMVVVGVYLGEHYADKYRPAFFVVTFACFAITLYMQLTSILIRKRSRQGDFQNIDVKHGKMSVVLSDDGKHSVDSDDQKPEVDSANIIQNDVVVEVPLLEASGFNKNVCFSSFENYFRLIIAGLERQISISDEKASVLLDKGSKYARYGVYFLVICIFFWQIISYFTGFQQHYLYGMASCTVLFLFIEFLSAWFLRQYRSFVDTSTYIVKIKSIFDKYMLAYLYSEKLNERKFSTEKMLAMLGEEIKWPETYLLKNGDVSFAKEAVECMTHFARSMKENFKSGNGESAKK